VTDQALAQRQMPANTTQDFGGYSVVMARGEAVASSGGVKPAFNGNYDDNLKTLQNAYYRGYTLNSSYTGLVIPSGYAVSQNGIFVTTVGAVYNYGVVGPDSGGDNGILLEQGGYVFNGPHGYIGADGPAAIAANTKASTVINQGAIYGVYDGVDLNAGGYVDIGVGGTVRAHRIAVGVTGGVGTVLNLGTLTVPSDTGVVIFSGTIMNGDSASPAGVIAALTGVYGTSATVVNYGTISGANGGSGRNGVLLTSGGKVVNGTATDTSALILDAYAVNLPTGSVTNFGVIDAVSAYGGGFAVNLGTGSSLTNGSLQDRQVVIEGNTGVIMGAKSSVANFGTILGVGTAGLAVNLEGATLTNGSGADTTALVRGYRAIVVSAAGTVTNFGTVEGTKQMADTYAVGDYAILFTKGGRLNNGSQAIPGALIEGYGGVQIQGAAGSVVNAGTIEALGRGGQYAVDLAGGGQIVNGGFSDPQALIEGVNGVGFGLKAHSGTVINYGVIEATYAAVTMNTAGGKVVNGGATQQGALIEGGEGISNATSVINYGTIRATAPNIGAVYSSLATTVTNGGSGDRTALVIGNLGVEVLAGGTVVNFGTVIGQGAAGVLIDGGAVTNGGGTDRTALIEGLDGIEATGRTATVRNSGVIMGTGGANSYGALLAAGGALINGSTSNAAAQIEGYSGLSTKGPGSVSNFGTILGQGDTGGAGVYDLSGASVSNGAVGQTGAIIDGYFGVVLGSAGGAVLTNFGTIIGQSGDAVSLQSASDMLVAEAGSTFIGAIHGGGGILNLGSGVGTLTGLLSTYMVVSGSMAATTFTNFGTVIIGSASFSAAGGGAVGAGQGLIDQGTLTTTGTLSVAGTLTTSGTLAGTGTLAISGGTTAFNAGTSLTIAKVKVTGGNVNVGSALAYGSVWSQTGGTISVAAGSGLTFTGAGDSFSGALSGAGSLVFSGGSDTFSGLSLSVTSQSISTATVTLSGAITLGANLSVTTPNLIVAVGGATISGAGELVLSNTATNSLHGASAAATLTDNGKIVAAGQIGGGVMKLIIGSTGSIDGKDALALTLDTGANTIANAGVIYAVGAGGTIVDSAIANTGKLYADGGTLTLEGAVSGAGVGDINGGTLYAASTFTENVSFLGTTGTLELAHSQTYTGDITGLSTAGTNSLDLNDIAFGANTKATYSGTTTSGTLTVTDGTHTAKITLEGNYTTSTFKVSSDGHGGTTVVDPSKAARGHSFIGAMAAMGDGAASVGAQPEPWRPAGISLVAPQGG
jgi:hypothetical protein